jgi:hypothetical protein
MREPQTQAAKADPWRRRLHMRGQMQGGIKKHAAMAAPQVASAVQET